MPTIGEMRHPMVLQEAVETADAFGERDRTWRDHARVWGKLEPLRGDEFITARQLGASIDYRIWLRYQDGVVPKMRIKYGTRIFEIVSVINWREGRQWLELMCAETI